MSRIYEICADEAWTHSSNPPNRYWCFFGGVFGLESDLGKMETKLRCVLEQTSYRREVKWGNISAVDLPVYVALVNEFFECLESYPIAYRQIFLDKAFVYVPSTAEETRSDLDVQYRICYQFLKHSFGIKYLPKADNTYDQIYVRLDSHSSQEHTESLKQFSQDLPKSLGRTDLVVDVSFVNSKKHLRMQLCDVLMGAAGSHGNKMHLRREAGQRGMTLKQQTRHELSKHIYSKFRLLNQKTRGSAAFNWFESTGHDGSQENRLFHKIRIWKFKPTRYQLDKGWENDHLDKQGRYQKADMVPEIRTTHPEQD